MSITLSKQTSVYRQVDAILKRKIYTAETSILAVVRTGSKVITIFFGSQKNKSNYDLFLIDDLFNSKFIKVLFRAAPHLNLFLKNWGGWTKQGTRINFRMGGGGKPQKYPHKDHTILFDWARS